MEILHFSPIDLIIFFNLCLIITIIEILNLILFNDFNIFIFILFFPISASANTNFVFATNWVAQPEHGGFYQALTDGEYNKCGLDVEIIQGGPGSNNRAKLITNKIDLYMGGNLIQLINSRAEAVPIKMTAAFFQKDPQIIISHPEGNLTSWGDLTSADPIFISDMGLVTFFRWMEKEHGFNGEKRRPYLFNSAPFLANKNSAQQGYLTSEPFSIKKEMGVRLGMVVGGEMKMGIEMEIPIETRFVVGT